MKAKRFKTKLITGFIVFLLCFAGYYLIIVPKFANSSKTSSDHRGVLGPKELLKNNGFSTVSSWDFIDGVYGSNTFIDAGYDNYPPNSGQFSSRDPFDSNTGITVSSYIQQNFTKSIWTPNYPTAVIYELNWNMRAYHSEVDNGTNCIDGEIFLKIVNVSTPNNVGEWIIASKPSTFQHETDFRIGKWYLSRIPVGANQGTFSIRNPGTYKLSIEIRLTVPVATNVDLFICDLRIDNVSLSINDVHEPLIIANKNTFGPYNADPLNMIDVDFYPGGLENTTLKEGKWRLNNSGMPGPWQTIFRNQNSYSQNWSITPIWNSMYEGKNTIDIYCEDAVGNYNDSVQITVIKDIKAPVSQIIKLNNSYKGYEISIPYIIHDPAPSGGHNNSVELWFRHNQTGKFVKYQPPWNPSGLFNNSPIRFNITSAGIAYGFGMYEFYTRGIDNATNYETTPAQSTKTNIMDPRDTTPPVPIFTAPVKKHNRGIVTINVSSDKDTKYIEFYYWLDFDSDCSPDPDYISSTWKLIGNLTFPTISNNWSIEWNTTDFSKYPEFKNSECMVILKASAVDKKNNCGEVFKNNIEIDNIAPKVVFVSPKIDVPEKKEDINICYHVFNDDVVSAKFWFSRHNEENWRLIKEGFEHPAGEYSANFTWKIPDFLKNAREIIDIKVEVFDDADNVGSDIIRGFIPPPNYFLGFREEFPREITLFEDFGIYILSLSNYKYCSDPDIKLEDLRFYVTGNSEKIFYISGSNNSGVVPDTFTFKSILDTFGTEKLVFHLVDPLGFEATIEQIVVVSPIDDWPVLGLPTDPFHVTYGKPDTIELSIYISDVDNPLADLMIFTDDTEHITVSGLNLTFNYPASMNGMNKVISIQVSDGEKISKGTISVKITDNQRPIWTKPFPIDLKLKEDETLLNIFYLENHFMDPEKQTLTYSASSENVLIEINANSSVTLRAKPNVNGREKVVFRATDPLGAWVEAVLYIHLIAIPDPPWISHIPDMNIHWHNPQSDNGYTYDFSYFITDPDNDDSELTIWARAVTEYTDDNWMENDPNYNMRMTFKFPFSAAGKIHRLALYVEDPQGLQNYRIFNITVIFEEWPVEQLKPIPDQYFNEDERKDDAFDLWDYFSDIDGGTTFEILSDPECMIKADIDENNFVDISCKYRYWYGEDQFVVLAKDAQPEQYVYDVVEVYVLNGEIYHFWEFPSLKMVIGQEIIIDYLKDIIEIDAQIDKLDIGTNDPKHVRANGNKLIFKFDTEGTYEIKGWIQYPNCLRNDTWSLTVIVDEPPDNSKPGIYEEVTPGLTALIILIIIIIIFLIFLALKIKKKSNLYNNKDEEKISHLPVTPIKRHQAQKMSDKILDSHQTIEASITQTPTQPSQVTSPYIPTAPSPQPPPTNLEPINQQIQTIN